MGLHDCSGPSGVTTQNCSYAQDYKDMVELVRTLGTTEGVSPKIYAMIPPPLMQQYAIGANNTVINTVYPRLCRRLRKIIPWTAPSTSSAAWAASLTGRPRSPTSANWTRL